MGGEVGIVVDASVCAKWFFPEEHSDHATRLLLSDEAFRAPELLMAEFGSIVWKKRIRGEINDSDALEAVSDFGRTRLELSPTHELALDALAIGVALRHSFYDCLYLALAERDGIKLVTADRRFRNKVAGTRFADRLLWIEDLP